MPIARIRHAAEGMSTIEEKDSVLGNLGFSGAEVHTRFPQLRRAMNALWLGPSRMTVGQAEEPAVNHPREGFMNQHVNRRTLVAATAANLVIGTALTSAASEAEQLDAELYRLEAEFKTAFAAMRQSDAKVDEVNMRVQSMLPPEPTDLPMTDELAAAFDEMPVKHMGDPRHPVGVAILERSKANKQRREAWRAECERIEEDCGLFTAQAEHSRSIGVVDEIADAILATPSQTLAGMLTKLRVHEDWDYEADEILSSIAEDIKAMANLA